MNASAVLWLLAAENQEGFNNYLVDTAQSGEPKHTCFGIASPQELVQNVLQFRNGATSSCGILDAFSATGEGPAHSCGDQRLSPRRGAGLTALACLFRRKNNLTFCFFYGICMQTMIFLHFSEAVFTPPKLLG